MPPDVWEGPLYVVRHGFSRGILTDDTTCFPHGVADGVPFSPTMMFPRGYDRLALQRNKFAKPSRAEWGDWRMPREAEGCGRAVEGRQGARHGGGAFSRAIKALQGHRRSEARG